jgi:hypothetical protein
VFSKCNAPIVPYGAVYSTAWYNSHTITVEALTDDGTDRYPLTKLLARFSLPPPPFSSAPGKAAETFHPPTWKHPCCLPMASDSLRDSRASFTPFALDSCLLTAHLTTLSPAVRSHLLLLHPGRRLPSAHQPPSFAILMLIPPPSSLCLHR